MRYIALSEATSFLALLVALFRATDHNQLHAFVELFDHVTGDRRFGTQVQ